MKIALVFLVLGLCGCRYVNYQTGDGRSVTYLNFAFDTKVGELTASDSKGDTITLKNLDSQSKAWDTMQQALQKIP